MMAQTNKLMNAHTVQLWDTRRVADAIESYWRSSVHDQFHRDALVDLLQHCLPTSSPTLLDAGCGPALTYERLAAVPTPAALTLSWPVIRTAPGSPRTAHGRTIKQPTPRSESGLPIREDPLPQLANTP